MAFSPANDAPSIRVFDSGCFPLPGRGPPPLTRPSVAMAIPNARTSDAPPPLIPDRHIGKQIQCGHDAGWKWGNSPSSTTFGGIKPGSSLLGGHPSQPRASVSRSFEDLDLNNNNNTNTNTTMDVDSDEETAQQRIRPSRPLESGAQPIRLAPVANPASRNAYDRQILSKINSLSSTPGTPNHATPPRLSVSTQEPPTSRTESPRLSVSAQDSAVPPLRRQSEAVPGFWRSKSGPISPVSSFRSPGAVEGELVPHSFHQHRGSYDHSVFAGSECGVEDTALRDPFHRGRSPAGSDEYRHGSTAGQKRRASSPPPEAVREDRAMANGSVEPYHRRGTLALVPPASPMQRRCTTMSGSYPSASSSLMSQRQSLGSSINPFSGASSMTSYNGDQLFSPGTLPSSAEPDGSISPYAPSRGQDSGPRCSLPCRTGLPEQEHQHQARGVPSDGIHFIRQGSVASQMSGTWICECCPKKPKKFDSEAELRVHESEKQYTCQYCPNRFKNKNEAERHQNSLHIRQFSWSCAALADASSAFHPSSPAPSATDVCGYCGQEFKNPPDWQERREHLHLSHKYGECNKVKKFYRADHFRQHLKHTHAGTSGKWTNHLENACMQNEDPPAKMQRQASSSPTIPLAPKPNGETGSLNGS